MRARSGRRLRTLRECLRQRGPDVRHEPGAHQVVQADHRRSPGLADDRAAQRTAGGRHLHQDGALGEPDRDRAARGRGRPPAPSCCRPPAGPAPRPSRRRRRRAARSSDPRAGSAWVASVTLGRGTECETSPSTNDRSVAVTGWVDSTWTPRRRPAPPLPRIALSGTRVTEPGGTGHVVEALGTERGVLGDHPDDDPRLVVAVVGQDQGAGARARSAGRAAAGRRPAPGRRASRCRRRRGRARRRCRRRRRRAGRARPRRGRLSSPRIGISWARSRRRLRPPGTVMPRRDGASTGPRGADDGDVGDGRAGVGVDQLEHRRVPRRGAEAGEPLVGLGCAARHRGRSLVLSRGQQTRAPSRPCRGRSRPRDPASAVAGRSAGTSTVVVDTAPDWVSST